MSTKNRFRMSLTTLLVSLVTISLGTLPAWADDPVDIPDVALKAAVMEALALTTDPTPSDMLGLSELYAVETGIVDLTGLEYAANLTHLRLEENQIADISPLSGLTNLTELTVKSTRISDIGPLVGLTNLTTLVLPHNDVSDISPLSGLVNLQNLYLNYSQVVDMSPLANLTNLRRLNLQASQVRSISALSGLGNLVELDLQNNKQISDISALSGLTQLTILRLNWNQISDISPLAGLTNLTALDIARNQIADITALANLVNLTSLNIAQNQVVDLSALSGLTQLTYLATDGNPIAGNISPLSGLTNLVRLEARSNEISDVSALVGLTNLRDLTLAANLIADLSPLDNLTQLEKLNLDWNLIGDLSLLANLTNLGYVSFAGNQIDDLAPLSGLVDLYRIIARDNLISDVSPLAELTKINIVELDGNQITDVSALTVMMTLQELNLKGNPLHPAACVIDIPLIRANNPGIAIHYDACAELLQTLTVSSTPGGSVVMPGEDVFTYLWGEMVPVEAMADEGYQFAHWSGTAVDANAMLDSSAIHTSVIVDADYSLTAHFELQEEPWSTIYFNDFEDEVGPEWSDNLVDATPIGQRRFLGRFGNEAVTLVLADLPAHSDVRISFDVFIIRSWDGDGLPAPPGVGTGAGPDIWSLEIQDGPTLLRTTFDNHITQPYLDFHRQSYPYEYPYAESLPQTGAAEGGTLGYVWPHPEGEAPADSVYHLDYLLAHLDQSIQFNFSASLSSPLNNESWGLDNVRIEVLTAAVQLTVSSTAGGSVTDPSEGVLTYDHGTSVSVQATAETNYHFTHWSGTAVDAGKVADPVSAATTVVADGDYTLVANFAIDKRTLTASSTAGGAVTNPSEGALAYDHGTSVSVQATTEANYHFTHWSGTAVDAGKVADPASAATTVAVDGDYTLVANFAIDQHTLTVSSTAGGSVTNPSEGALAYDHGTSVSVQATAETGYHFAHWSGTAVDAGKVADPASAATTVVVDGDYTLVANFAIDQRTLTISSAAGGSVMTPGEGTLQYSPGESVAIWASADEHYRFTHWSGTAVDAGKVADPNSQHTTVTVDANYTLVANFKIGQHRLTVSAGEGGYVSIVAEIDGTARMWLEDKSLLFDHGTKITVTATPSAPWYFKWWTGNIGSDSATMTFVLTEDWDLQAVFSL